MAFNVTVIQNQKSWTKEYTSPILLMDAIAESGFCFDLPCGGRGICGNCRVIACGILSEPTDEEKRFLKEQINNKIRLACMTYAKGDCVVEIPSSRTVVFKNSKITENADGFACALDVGTTTLAFEYYSLSDGHTVYSEHLGNPQRVRGADVLTRIAYAADGGLGELKALIEKEIELSRSRFGQEVDFYIITGNTAMLHILTGRSPKGLAVAPFAPETLFGFWEGNRYYMPCASAYVGSDVIASLLTCGGLKHDQPFALLDIGTNNECILFDGSKLYACSSPAGPAFEGASISCGMTAHGGAICAVNDVEGRAVLKTVEDGAVPTGFCGSGLIDAVAYLLKYGYIENDGDIKKELPTFGKAKLLAADIAELQLAKSAVCAGLLTLCDKAGIKAEQLNKIYLAGSFGNKINAKNAEAIGLLPKGTAKKAVYTGSAIDGAAMLLLDRNYIKQAEDIAKSIETVELADSGFFAKAFIENLYF